MDRRGGSREKPVADMGIILKSPREIELMREAGKLVCRILDKLEAIVAPGVTTGELNRAAEELINACGATALFKGVKVKDAKFAFPAVLCTSVNDEVVHGIPGGRKLREGDIVSVDCGVRLAGYCGDSARTLRVGRVAAEAERLLKVTQDTLSLALREMRPGRYWSDIARTMQKFVEDQRFTVVRKFVGHGIGREMHEEPKVPNYWDARQNSGDFQLKKGMTVAVEPMVNMGKAAVAYGNTDNWVVVTKDGKYAAHFEHTVAVTDTGVDVLTISG